MLPSKSNRKASTGSIDDNDVFTSNALKKDENPQGKYIHTYITEMFWVRSTGTQSQKN